MPKKLLLADDSITIQKVVSIALSNEDHALTVVDNGKDALAKARELQPDLVLADVVMPGLTGYEVCQALKSDPSTNRIPVLLLAGTFESFDETRARAAGANGHIMKPFDSQTLVSKVNELLGIPSVAGTSVTANLRSAPSSPPSPVAKPTSPAAPVASSPFSASPAQIPAVKPAPAGGPPRPVPNIPSSAAVTKVGPAPTAPRIAAPNPTGLSPVSNVRPGAGLHHNPSIAQPPSSPPAALRPPTGASAAPAPAPSLGGLRPGGSHGSATGW